MKVMLLKKLNNFGIKGEIIDVKNGFAKNYLIPQNIATQILKKNIKDLTNLIEKPTENYFFSNYNFELNNITIILPVKIKSNNEIYGVINNSRLSKIIKFLKLNLNIKDLTTNFFLKKIGNYKIEFFNKKTNIITNVYLMLIRINDQQK